MGKQEEQVVSMSNSNKGTVLVIDDEKDLVELVRYNLEKEGFDVIAAADGTSGLEIAQAHKPDPGGARSDDARRGWAGRLPAAARRTRAAAFRLLC